MPVFRSPYSTTAASALLNTGVYSSIVESMLKDNIDKRDLSFINDQSDDTSLILITGETPSESNIPFFAHPIEIRLDNVRRSDRKTYLVADARQMIMISKDQRGMDELYFRNKLDYDFLRIRMALLRVWYESDPQTLSDISTIPASIFCNWIAENINQRFYLDPKDQVYISIVVCFYYHLLFIQKTEFEESEKYKMIKTVEKCTGAKSEHVIDVMERLIPMKDVRDLCTCIVSIVEDPRIADFNLGLLLTLISNSWFGINSKENLACAMEHPPTWISIVYSAYVERSFKNSKIAKIAERYGERKGQNDFTKSLILLVKDSLKD